MATSVKYPTANTATTGFNAVATNPTYAYTDDTNFALIAGLGRNQEGAHNRPEKSKPRQLCAPSWLRPRPAINAKFVSSV